MRPNTRESGIFSTKRRSPVSTSMLTRMLVPNPKNAFQSPGVHSAGFFMALLLGQRREDTAEIGDPAEDAALRLDHGEAGLVELGEVRRAAVARDDAAITAVV